MLQKSVILFIIHNVIKLMSASLRKMHYYLKRTRQLLRSNPVIGYLKYVHRTIAAKPTVRLLHMADHVDTTFGDYVTLGDHAVLVNCQVGSYTYFGPNSRCNYTDVGNFCSIAANVRCGLGQHPITAVSTSPVFYKASVRPVQVSLVDEDAHEEFTPITIGNDVWIGVNAIVMDGVTVGNGAIVAAGSVVTKDVVPYAIVAGTPAKVIRKRFTDKQIEFLENLQWWNKGLEWLSEHLHLWDNVDDLMLHVAQHP